MSLFVHEAGPPDAPTILFLHGAALSGRMWQPQLEALPDFHCLAPDLPEHGRSAEIGPITLSGTVALLTRLIQEQTQGGRAHVVGLSFGGVVAQALMVHAPHLVGHVMLSGTSMRLGRLMVALQGLNAPLLRLFPKITLAKLIMAQFAIPEDYYPYLLEDVCRFTPDAFARVNRLYAEIETPTTPTAPVLVTVGAKETFIAQRMAQSLAYTIPNARYLLVPGVGHAWNLQAPDLFTATLREFLSAT